LEAESAGSKPSNLSWNEVAALVSSGEAEIGVGFFSVTKERSEVVAYTNTIGAIR
jgi:ABC-type amino acid transport substrate-binding protein